MAAIINMIITNYQPIFVKFNQTIQIWNANTIDNPSLEQLIVVVVSAWLSKFVSNQSLHLSHALRSHRALSNSSLKKNIFGLNHHLSF